MMNVCAATGPSRTQWWHGFVWQERRTGEQERDVFTFPLLFPLQPAYDNYLIILLMSVFLYFCRVHLERQELLVQLDLKALRYESFIMLAHLVCLTTCKHLTQTDQE